MRPSTINVRYIHKCVCVCVCSDMQKRVQGKGVCRGSLLHLLDTMHAGSDLEMDFGDPDAWNDFDFNAKDDTWDVRPLDNPMWDQALLVPPSMLEADVEEFDPRDLHEIRAKVARCFGAEDLQSCVRRLREYEGEQWADEARNGLLRLDPFLAEVRRLSRIDVCVFDPLTGVVRAHSTVRLRCGHARAVSGHGDPRRHQTLRPRVR